jgi:TolB protein
MTPRDDFDRLLTAWFESAAPRVAPEHLLDQVLARTARTPRRRTWRLLEGLSSMQATMRLPAPARGLILLPMLLLLAIVAIALIAVGSERRLPSPFGLARPGLIAYQDNGDITLANVDGSGEIVLASGPAFGFGPAWSHDGSRLAYWSAANWDKPATLVVVGADGGHPEELVRDVVAPSSRISWSPDGRRVAFSAQVGAAYRLMVAEPGRSGAFPVGDASVQGKNPVWSPDGKTLAFIGGSTYRDIAIWLIGADGSDMRRLTKVNDTVELGEYDWSPDGKWLLFTAGSFSHHDVWVAAADGSDEHTLAATDANEYAPSWSPDGRRIAYVSEIWDGSRASQPIDKTVVVDADGSNPTIVGLDVNAGLWSPDGRRLVIWSPDGRYLVGWKPDPNGAGAPQLFDPAGQGAGARLPLAYPTSWQRLAP